MSTKKILNFLGLKKRQKLSEFRNIIALPWPPPVWGDSSGLNLLQTSQQPPKWGQNPGVGTDPSPQLISV
jgi:hypothetical protein